MGNKEKLPIIDLNDILNILDKNQFKQLCNSHILDKTVSSEKIESTYWICIT